MASGKNNILVYRDWITIFDDLSDEEAGRLIKHFFRYVNDLNPEPPDRLTSLLFNQIKTTLKRDLKKWEEKAEKNRENAILRWDKKNANACERIKSDANYADSDSDNDRVNDSDKEINIREKSTRFIPPTLEEVKNYCFERKNSIDPEKWFDFYSAKNWMIGKNKMKDWRAAVRTWEKSEKIEKPQKFAQSPATYKPPSRRLDQDDGFGAAPDYEAYKKNLEKLAESKKMNK